MCRPALRQSVLFTSDATYNTSMRGKRQEWEKYEERWGAEEAALKDLDLSLSGVGNIWSVEKGDVAWLLL